MFACHIVLQPTYIQTLLRNSALLLHCLYWASVRFSAVSEQPCCADDETWHITVGIELFSYASRSRFCVSFPFPMPQSPSCQNSQH